MKKIDELNKRIKALGELIDNANKKREELIYLVRDINRDFNEGRISKSEYDNKLNEVLRQKSYEEWIDYYNDYIADCKNKIIQCRQLINEERISEKNFTKKTKFLGESFENSFNTNENVNYSKFSEENSFGKKETAASVLKVLVMIVFIGVIVALVYNFGPAVYDSWNHKAVKTPGSEITSGGKAIPEAKPSTKQTPVNNVPAERTTPKENVPEETIPKETISPIVPESEFASYKPVSIVSRNPKAEFNEASVQGSAAVGENVKWESDIEMKSPESFSVNIPDGAKVISVKDETGNEIKSLDNLEGGKDYIIEFETPAPKISKEVFDENKERVVVSSNADVHYKNVLSTIKVSEKLDLKESDKSKVKMYQIVNEGGTEQKIPTNFILYDTNEDGIIDRMEWITPHLSEAVFEIVIINITKAEHLDTNRKFITDIYDLVKTKDGVWSGRVGNGEFVRVNFEQNLTNKNDITIYARGSEGSTAEIEVYVKDSETLIAKFENVSNENTYKILLTSLGEGENYESFDLKIIGNVEFDYIVDPDTTPPSLEGTNVNGCNVYTSNIGERKKCFIKTGVSTTHQIRLYDGESTPDIEGLMFTLNGCLPPGCSSGDFINSYVHEDATPLHNVITNFNAMRVNTATCSEPGGCAGYHVKYDWGVSQGGTIEGEYYVWTYGQDQVGNQLLYTDTGLSYIVDNTVPTVELTSPSTTYIGPGSLYVTANVNDGSGIWECKATFCDDPLMNVCDVRDQTLTLAGNVCFGTLTIQPREGIKYLFIFVKDRALNENNDYGTFTLDATGPDVLVTDPLPGTAIMPNTNFLLKATVTDSSSGVSNCYAYYSQDEYWDTGDLQIGGPYTPSFSTCSGNVQVPAGDGTKYVIMRVSDYVENYGYDARNIIVYSVPPPSLYKFAIQDSTGKNVASIDDKGDMYLSKTASQSQSTLSPPTSSFVIYNSVGTAVAYFDKVGNLFMKGAITSNSDMSGGSTKFGIRDKQDNLVAFFDTAGNLKLKGGYIENYASP